MNNINLLDLLKIILVPIHKEGIKFIAIFAFITIIFSLFSSKLGLMGLVVTLWCIYFFRDPQRVTPEINNAVISPADGVVNAIENLASPPSELDFSPSIKWNKISVFLNVFDVHVNRIPISGTITQLNYQAGKFLSANLSEASTQNERQSAVVKDENGNEIVFVQVAGLVARRIICNLEEGQNVKAGERYGIIRFGSRADIYLPENAKIKVLVGQRMIGGETILAEFLKSSSVKAAEKTSSETKKITKTQKKTQDKK